MYRTASFLKLATLAILFTIFAAVIARTELSAAQITLSWTDNSNNEDGFGIERKTGTTGTYAPLITLAANTGSHVDSNLPDVTTFCYRLNAFNAAGSSAFSNEMCKTTPSVTPPIYLLSVSKAGTGSGTVTATGINCGSDCSESVASGTQVALTATAAGDSTFAGWTGTGCSSTVTVTGNLNCTATFSLVTFTLTVAKVGTGSGTVTATGINCGSDCSESVVSGTQVALTATAASGSTFAGWTGTGCGSTVTVTGNLTCTATFSLSTFTLTVAKAGTGSGTVTATGINCGSDCSESVVSGTQVALVATAASDSTFAGWTGTGCSSTVTVTGNMNCTATFSLVTFTLTVAKAGTGSGTVTATGINCGSDCSETVASGTQLALLATAASGSTFIGWTGTGCASTVTVTGNMNCTATFSLVTFTLTVAKAGTGSGTVTATGINCGSDCSESVVSGTQLALLATAASDSTFAGWTGTGCGSTVTVTGNLTCTATFNLSTFTLTVAKAGTGSGTVTATGINCGSDCSESIVSGTQVALAATAASGSTFAGWTGTGCASTVTVTGNLTCTATFNLSTFTLTVAKAGTGSGTVTATGINCGSDCSESIVSGTQVALLATAAGDSNFVGWTGTGCSSTMTVTGNLTCTATFNLKTFTLTVAKAGTGSGTVTATGINCGSDCSESVVKGTQVALTATAAGDSTFIGWTGTGCASTVTMTGNKTCTATFNSLALMDRIGLFRPSTGEWFLDGNGNGAWDDCQIDLCIQSFGAGSGVPVVGEWDASGLTQIGIFGPQTAQWNMDINTNETWDGCTVDLCLGPFGVSGDLPVVGKWTSGGYDRVGVYRPSTGNWYLDKNNDGSFTSCQSDQCAYLSVFMTGDLPVIGDWKGTGVSRLGLFRPSTGEWFLDYNGNRSWSGCSNDRCKSFGAAGDRPVTGDWNGSGKSKIGVFRPSTGEWFLDYNGNGIWDGCSVDLCAASFGLAGDVPFAGKW